MKSGSSASRWWRRARQRLTQELRLHGIEGEVQGRPKHIYSIWKKMRGKQVDFDHVFDIRALRVIVSSVRDCYAALSLVHESYRPLPEEFDDYIARPKANGYQSLHTVVYDEKGRAIEIQIRTGTMHEHAEHGVAAHWAYKEAGTKGYGGVSAAGEFEEKVAQARKAVLRQLLAWERDFSGQGEDAGLDDRIYVFTPQASVVELPRDATPVDFAYTVHTDLGHRCRGARIDGAMVPLNTPLSSGQTVEVITTKEGGPSMDWLNAELGYLKSSRAKAKVRAWFNALVQQQTIAKGRELVEKLLQREGRTAVKLEDLARQLGFKSADALFDVVGKDEYSLRNIEQLLRPSEPAPTADEVIALKKARSDAVSPKGGVLVVGVESLLTTLARCCRPAPPDAIGGYVTKGKGVRDPPQGLLLVQADRGAQSGTHDPGGLGHGFQRQDGRLSGGRGSGGSRQARPAARHLRSVREGEDERDRSELADREGPRLDDLHDRGHRFGAAVAGAATGVASGGRALCARAVG